MLMPYVLAELQGESPGAALSEGKQQQADKASVSVSRFVEAGNSPLSVALNTTDQDNRATSGKAASSKASGSVKSGTSSSSPATQDAALLGPEQQQLPAEHLGAEHGPNAPGSASEQAMPISSSTQEAVSKHSASATAQQSVEQDTPAMSEAAELVIAQHSAAQDMHALSAATAAPAEAMTPTKAQQSRPTDDLDRLMGSRLKSVRPRAGQGGAEAAPSPVASLRGQLRRVKLEPEEELGSPSLHAPQDKENTSANATQVRLYAL